MIRSLSNELLEDEIWETDSCVDMEVYLELIRVLSRIKKQKSQKSQNLVYNSILS